MRLLNKIAVGASAFAFAAALSAGVNTASADAASLEKSNFEFCCDESELVVYGSSDHKITVSYPTADKNGKLSADKNICTYDVISGGVVIELSTLNTTKDNYIKVAGDVNDTPVIIKIKAADQLGKAKTNATNGAISVPKKGTDTVYAASKLQFATTTSNWADMVDEDGNQLTFESMLQLGATLRVRVAPSGDMDDATAGTIADKAGVSYTSYEVKGNLPGKEIKVKLAKMANAPKAKVNYAKRTITIPKDCEYRINGASNNFSTWKDAWTKVTTATKLDGTTLSLTANGAVDVRKAATPNKPASKYSVTSWKGIYKFVVKKDASDAKKASLVVTKAGTSAEFEAVTGGAVDVTYEVTKASGKTATSAAVTINNTSELYSYQYIIVNKGSEVKLDTRGAKTLKTKKNIKITVKAAKSYEDKDIYIRRAAVTKGNTQWVTDWVKVATITNKAGTVTWQEQ